MIIDILLSPAALHIPDGFLNIWISILFWIISITMVSIAVRKTNNSLEEKQIPLMGIMAAFIFAAQMLNFPVAGGTSGHFLGGTLAAIVLGPWEGILVMTAVVAVQGFLFQDGGLLVMGANIFNMGILTIIIGFGLYRIVLNKSMKTRLAVIGIASWLATMTAALFTALQLWLSGTSTLEIVVPAMLGVHAIIGVGEAVITMAAVAFIQRTRPDFLNLQRTKSDTGRGWVYAGIIISVLVVLVSPMASGDPDGLEKAAEKIGILNNAISSPYTILPDYTIPFLGGTGLSTVLAGIVGIAVIFGIILLVGRGLKKDNQ